MPGLQLGNRGRSEQKRKKQVASNDEQQTVGLFHGLQLDYQGTPEYQRKMQRASRDDQTAGIFHSLLTRREMDALEGEEAGRAFGDFIKLKQLGEMKKEREVYLPEQTAMRREELGLKREEQASKSEFQMKELAQQLEQSETKAGLRMKGIESEAGMKGAEMDFREEGMKKAFPWQLANVGVSGLSAWEQIKQAQDDRDWKLGMAQKYGLPYGKT